MDRKKEYVGNTQNEYILDGKRYVEKIRGCSCSETVDGAYLLNCSILQRGEHSYRFRDGWDHIVREYGVKKLYLSEEAKQTVESVAGDFSAAVARVRENGVPLRIGSVAMRYIRSGWQKYETVIEYVHNEKKIVRLTHSSPLDSIPFCICTVPEARELSADRETTMENIGENPLYRSAVETGNKEMQLELRHRYNLTTTEETRRIGDIIGRTVLPVLPEEFDKNIIVQAKTISIKVLHDSNYRILHTPNFSMQGQTHDKWQLNPHRRMGIDSSGVFASSIPFSLYLEILGLKENEF